MAASMDNMLSAVVQSWLSNDSGYDSLHDILTVFNTNQLFSLQKTSGVQETLSHVHNCLSSGKRRVEGLLFLYEIVHQSTTEVFQQNSLTWIRLLLQILQSHCPPNVYSAACQILGQILSFAKNFSDISREIVNSVVPQLLPLLLSSPSELRIPAVTCINSCISAYPGPLGPFKNKVETLVTSELNKRTVNKEVCRCYALLAQCGPGGTMGIKYTEAWGQQCSKLMGSLENTLSDLYEGLESDRGSQQEKSTIALQVIDADESNRVSALANRWKTLTYCLESLLSEEMSATVKLPVERVLQLVCRCLSVNTKMLLSRPTRERILLAGLVPDMHIAALGTLNKLILLCRTQLMSHGLVVNKLMCQELLWTSTENCGQNMPYGALRETVYDVMGTWLKVLDGNSGIGNEEKTIVKQILKDCAPYEETLKLSTSNSSTKVDEAGPTKKKKRKGYQEIGQGISSQRKVHQYANSRLVSTALEALYWILTTAGTELDRTSAQNIQSFIIKTLLTIQQTKDLPIPYGSTRCRRGLYRVLQACTLTPHPTFPPPTQCAVGIFSAGLLDPNIEVSSFCVEAIRIAELTIHPRVPCLNGPIIVESVVKVGNASNSLTDGESRSKHFGNGVQSGKRANWFQASSSDSPVDGDFETTAVRVPSSAGKKRALEEEDDDNEGDDDNDDESDDDVVITKVTKEDPKYKPIIQNVSDSSDESEVDSESDDDVQIMETDLMDSDKLTEGVEKENDSSGDLNKPDAAVASTSTMDSSDKVIQGQSTDYTTENNESNTSTIMVDVSNGENESTSGQVTTPELKKDENKEVNSEVESMLMSFVDVGPDSD